MIMREYITVLCRIRISLLPAPAIFGLFSMEKFLEVFQLLFSSNVSCIHVIDIAWVLRMESNSVCLPRSPWIFHWSIRTLSNRLFLKVMIGGGYWP